MRGPLSYDRHTEVENCDSNKWNVDQERPCGRCFEFGSKRNHREIGSPLSPGVDRCFSLSFRLLLRKREEVRKNRGGRVYSGLLAGSFYDALI